MLPCTVAKIWGIRTALELYNSKLSHWSATTIYKASDEQITFKLKHGNVFIVRHDDDTLGASDEAVATAAGIDIDFARQALLLKGVEDHQAHVAHVKSIKHAGWTLDNGKWAVMISQGVSELVYVHQMIQYDGWIKNGQEESSYESGHVFLKCFRFTFTQLKLEKRANMLRVHESRLATLFRAIEQQISSFDNLHEFPFPIGGCEAGRWPCTVLNLYDVLAEEEGKFAPIFFAGRRNGDLVFTYR